MDNKLLSLYTKSLQDNFKHFSLKFQSSDAAEHARAILQQELEEALELNGGKAFRITRLSRTELLIYLVTRAQDSKDWRQLLLQILQQYKLKFIGLSHLSIQNNFKAQANY